MSALAVDEVLVKFADGGGAVNRLAAGHPLAAAGLAQKTGTASEGVQAKRLLLGGTKPVTATTRPLQGLVPKPALGVARR